MRKEDKWIWAGMAALVVALLVYCYVQPIMESRTYNRLTGANTTAWDALWVELRVQGETEGKP